MLFEKVIHLGFIFIFLQGNLSVANDVRDSTKLSTFHYYFCLDTDGFIYSLGLQRFKGV